MAKILYVEDNPDIFELAQRWLVRKGHDVLHASDGPSALAIVETELPDLILLDLDLGEFSFDGWEVNRRLKEGESTRKIPVICLTAHAQLVEYRERALSEGFVEHLSKPFDKATFLDRVSSYLPSEKMP